MRMFAPADADAGAADADANANAGADAGANAGAGADAGEEPAPCGGEFTDLTATNESREVPGRQLLPHVPPLVEREEVPGRLEFLGDVAADVHVADAGDVGRVVRQGRAGVASTPGDTKFSHQTGTQGRHDPLQQLPIIALADIPR